MKTTAKTLAKALDLSPAAVSLALNGKPGVSDETRQRVLNAARDMGYTPAKSSAKRVAEDGARQNIKFVFYQKSASQNVDLESAFSSLVLKGVDKQAKELGYNLLVNYFYEDGDWEQQLRELSSDTVGVIMMATVLNTKYLSRFRSINMPIIFVDNDENHFENDFVVSDNRHGAFLAMKYLIDLGHRHICYVKVRERISNYIERENGVRRAQKLLLSAVKGTLQRLEVGNSSEEVFRDVCTWIESRDKDADAPFPTAIFADNDAVAAACIRALTSFHYNIPRDVSVMGFDDLPICTVVEPTITSVLVHKTRLGEIAMQRLHMRLQSPPPENVRTILSTKIIERQSVSAPPEASLQTDP